ncbi:hypothetical protein AC1031_020993 [Aphanomyces cochlioides]|nr:hypothetical protein AC1031_020993 [Aphanomyces cochlioides]
MALDEYEERLRASVRLLASKLASAATPPVISEESNANSLSTPTPVIWNISSPSPTIAPQSTRGRTTFLDAKILNEPAVVLADRHWCQHEHASAKTGIDGFGNGSATTAGTVPIKLTIGDGLTYLFTIAVCDFGPVGFHAIIGMDFLEKAGMIIDTVKREIQLPDDNWIPLVLQPIKYNFSLETASASNYHLQDQD